MQINEKKLERQELGVYKFINSSKYGSPKNCLGTLNYTMGFGKTYTAILIIKFLIKNRDRNHFVIIVPSETLKIQWDKIISNSFSKKDQLIIEVFTVSWVIRQNSFIKTYTLILDEIHEYISEKYIKVLNGALIGKDEVLGLTGTATDNINVMSILREFCPVIDIIAEKEAIESGYISNFVEYNIPISLTGEEQSEYNRLSQLITDNMSKFGNGGLSLANKCLGGGKHTNGKVYTGIQFAFGWAAHNGWRKGLDLTNPIDAKIDNLWNPHKIIGYSKALINAVRHRRNILYSCTNKVNLTLELTRKFNDIKTIIFSESTAFADKVGLLINEDSPNSAVVYHSQLQPMMMPSPKSGKLIKFGSKRLKERAMDRIRKGLSRILVTSRSLDRGLDIEDIRLGITSSGTQNPTQYKQRGGRVKRKETSLFTEDTVVLIINMFVKDTKDEVWLKKRQSKSNHIIHYANTIDEIVFKPKSNFDI
jgi:superfamily II DNA or RNA helicase